MKRRNPTELPAKDAASTTTCAWLGWSGREAAAIKSTRGHDRHHAGGESVDAVDEVDRVLDAHDPDQGERQDEKAQLGNFQHSEVQGIYVDVKGNRGRERHATLEEELKEWREAKAVIDREDHCRDARQGEEPQQLRVVG
ncbi:MAG: hypothetical protein M3072_02430 [Candidatus Dormibacteraeota bacterium]|nr:hypothetical protein [Candidatus Dormibacteraeota bacterium]